MSVCSNRWRTVPPASSRFQTDQVGWRDRRARSYRCRAHASEIRRTALQRQIVKRADIQRRGGWRSSKSCVWRIADSRKIGSSPHTDQAYKNDHAFRIAAFAPRSTTSPCATVSRSKSHSRMPASAASANRRRILISKRNVLGMARPPNPPSSPSTIRVSASSEWFTLNIRSVNNAVRLRRSKNIVSLRAPNARNTI